MNSGSMCRADTDHGYRCGLYYGHDGNHQCCTLHIPKPQYARPEEGRPE